MPVGRWCGHGGRACTHPPPQTAPGLFSAVMFLFVREHGAARVPRLLVIPTRRVRAGTGSAHACWQHFAVGRLRWCCALPLLSRTHARALHLPRSPHTCTTGLPAGSLPCALAFLHLPATTPTCLPRTCPISSATLPTAATTYLRFVPTFRALWFVVLTRTLPPDNALPLRLNDNDTARFTVQQLRERCG